MAADNKSHLITEYVKKLNLVYIPISRLSALNRFDIKNGQIVSKSKYSLFYSIIAVLMVNICAYFVLRETTVNNNYLILPEYISVIQFIILSNANVLNIFFLNRHSGAELMRNFIEIDVFLGIKETGFMRRITYKDAAIWCSFVGGVQVSLIVILILTFHDKVSIFSFICSIVYFGILFCMTYDLVFHVVIYKFICMRVHYLNVALVKTAKLKKKYLTDKMLEYPLLWKKEYDDFVNSRWDSKYYVDALKMIFDQRQRITKCYRFVIFTSTVCLVISTFLAVQSVIIVIKDPEVPLIRTMALVGWFFVGWMIFAGITLQIDKFYVQIQRTRLICTYIQLKPNKTDEIYELSKKILDILSVSDYRYPIYDMFYYDGRLMTSVATSVFVYITMQLQIAFPKGFNQKENATVLTY